MISLSIVAFGRAAAAQDSGFALNRFDPAEHGSDWFNTESLDYRGHLRPSAGLVLDYAYRPLVIYDENDDVVASIVEHQLFGHVGGGVLLWERIRAGVNVPIALYTGGDEDGGTVDGVTYTSAEGISFGDLRFSADARIVGQYGDPFVLAGGVQLHLPTGDQDHFAGDGGLRFVPRVLVAGDVSLLAYAARVGVNIHSNTDNFGGEPFGTELTYGLSLGVRLLEKHLLIGPELFGSTVVSDSGDGLFKEATTPLDLVLGAHYKMDNGLQFGVGAGPGLTGGFGTPTVRALANVSWTMPYEGKDRDFDGILDKDDACPDVKGVRTDDPKTNGCPPDRDRDGIVDGEDACPDVKGKPSENPDLNGCPDQDGDGIIDSKDACPTKAGNPSSDPKLHGCPDRDGDGILDDVDACPDKKGVPSEDPQKHGCPLPDDRDGDGIPDSKDACPDTKGIASPDAELNGCPDTDGDGIFDKKDACPDSPGKAWPEPERNGCPDRDGDDIIDKLDACPDKKGVPSTNKSKNGCPQAAIVGKQIKIQNIEFDTNKATLRPNSLVVLNAVLKILNEHQEIKLVRVEGHTDNQGGRQYNVLLSKQRAQAVVNWLTAKGVDKNRLKYEGFGPDKPIDDNKTNEGRQNNRRVEFHIEK